MTTLIAPEATPLPADWSALPRLPRDEQGPVFAEPWQATVFALAVRLSAAGCFTWTEWATTLGDEFKRAADRGEPADGTAYYNHWLAALEQLVVEKGISDLQGLLACKEAWADAYRHTPHGQPVVLARDVEVHPAR
jgi:nitrile hydratase accessory protein